jgi:hypothetical protein
MRVPALTFGHAPLVNAPLVNAPLGMRRADEGNRTPNRLFTKQVLCQLSYVSRKRPNQDRLV